jgi:DNA mismatch endonuclease (patch repair protein)
MAPRSIHLDPDGKKKVKNKRILMTRSENMSHIHGKDTQPEMSVRHAFWKAGLRYRLHDKKLPGHPDIVFPSRKTVVFIHGCFWHCHEGCNNFRIPKTRSEWWTAKLMRNKIRDANVFASLNKLGWRIIIIWECDICKINFINNIINEIKLINILIKH